MFQTIHNSFASRALFLHVLSDLLLLCEHWSDYLKCYSYQGGLHKKISKIGWGMIQLFKISSLLRKGLQKSTSTEERNVWWDSCRPFGILSAEEGIEILQVWDLSHNSDHVTCLVPTNPPFSGSSFTLLSLKPARCTYLNCWFVCPPYPSAKLELFWEPASLMFESPVPGTLPEKQQIHNICWFNG